nr:unnamed protein product [Callosobruchus chinensis]
MLGKQASNNGFNIWYNLVFPGLNLDLSRFLNRMFPFLTLMNHGDWGNLPYGYAVTVHAADISKF